MVFNSHKWRKGGTFYRQTYGLSTSFYCVWAVLVSPLFFILLCLGQSISLICHYPIIRPSLKRCVPWWATVLSSATCRFAFRNMPPVLSLFFSCLLDFFLIVGRFLLLFSFLVCLCQDSAAFTVFFSVSFFPVFALWLLSAVEILIILLLTQNLFGPPFQLMLPPLLVPLVLHINFYVSNCLYFYMFFLLFYSVFNM